LELQHRARGVCVAAPNKTEQIPNSVVGGVGQSPQIPEPELIMSTGVAAVAVAISTWTAQQAEPLRQLGDDLGSWAATCCSICQRVVKQSTQGTLACLSWLERQWNVSICFSLLICRPN